MSGSDHTIFGLSSGALPSGIAVVRVSGAECRKIADAMFGSVPVPRKAVLGAIKHSVSNVTIDHGLVLFFPGPASFTGEDCIEFHVHGGKAVVSSVFDSLSAFQDVRLAEAGEFTRRAFENGKLDLTESEGLADLISAQTEEQRRQALAHASGFARDILEDWRSRLIRVMALFAAEIDFVEEDDIPEAVSKQAFTDMKLLLDELSSHLDDNRWGEIVHDGYRIALMGRPNSGKSSLLNALAQRDVAIVTDIAGTTRDVLSVNLDIGGFHVIVSDTAGIRESDDIVEQEGIRRAKITENNADLVIWLEDRASELSSLKTDRENDRTLVLLTKDDSGALPDGQSISSVTGHGLQALSESIRNRLDALCNSNENSALVVRKRHREHLENAVGYLDAALNNDGRDIELQVENLRLASDSLGKVTGLIDVEDLLDVIFSEFCVGK